LGLQPVVVYLNPVKLCCFGTFVKIFIKMYRSLPENVRFEKFITGVGVKKYTATQIAEHSSCMCSEGKTPFSETTRYFCTRENSPHESAD